MAGRRKPDRTECYRAYAGCRTGPKVAPRRRTPNRTEYRRGRRGSQRVAAGPKIRPDAAIAEGHRTPPGRSLRPNPRSSAGPNYDNAEDRTEVLRAYAENRTGPNLSSREPDRTGPKHACRRRTPNRTERAGALPNAGPDRSLRACAECRTGPNARVIAECRTGPKPACRRRMPNRTEREGASPKAGPDRSLPAGAECRTGPNERGV